MAVLLKEALELSQERRSAQRSSHLVQVWRGVAEVLNDCRFATRHVRECDEVECLLSTNRPLARCELWIGEAFERETDRFTSSSDRFLVQHYSAKKQYGLHAVRRPAEPIFDFRPDLRVG